MPNLDLSDNSVSEDDPLWIINIDGYRFVAFLNEVFVYKGNDTKKSYTITRLGGCDCPSAMYNGGPCKHMRTITSAGEERTIAPIDRSETLEVDLF